MATKKSTTKIKESDERSQEKLTQMANDSFENGKRAGAQEVWNSMASFLQDRMIKHFESRHDDLARELREILSAIKQNIA